MSRKRELETRIDLYERWIIENWFGENTLAYQDFRKKLFRIWLELFMALYDDLTEKVGSTKKRDSIFLHFTNEVFPGVLDDFKWYESERSGRDIGLFEALEHVPLQAWYIELLSRFSQIY